MTAAFAVTVALRRSLSLTPASAVRGTLTVPGDKSISHRYVMLGGAGRARPPSPISRRAPTSRPRSRAWPPLAPNRPAGPNALAIAGLGAAAFRQPGAPLDAGNSGTTLRLLSGLVASQPIRVARGRRIAQPPAHAAHHRPVERDGRASSTSANGRSPLVIEGGALQAIDWLVPVASAQVKSAILLAGLGARGTTIVREPLLTRDHTERAFPAFGLRVRTAGTISSVDGGQTPVAPAGRSPFRAIPPRRRSGRPRRRRCPAHACASKASCSIRTAWASCARSNAWVRGSR